MNFCFVTTDIYFIQTHHRDSACSFFPDGFILNVSAVAVSILPFQSVEYDTPTDDVTVHRKPAILCFHLGTNFLGSELSYFWSKCSKRFKLSGFPHIFMDKNSKLFHDLSRTDNKDFVPCLVCPAYINI